MRKPRYIYHSISSNSGIARQEQAQVQELQATQAQRAITTASLQIIPKSCIYCALLALILHYLPFKIRNISTRTGTTATAHAPRTLSNTRGSVREHVLTDIAQQSIVCIRTNLNHEKRLLFYFYRLQYTTLFVKYQYTENTLFTFSKKYYI